MEQKIKAAQNDGGLSRDAAIEEVVADACEMVMGNSKAIERLAKEKPGLAKRIADWLHEFFSDIRKAFEGVEARHEEAKAMLDYMDELAKLWDDALVEAAENRGGTKKAEENNPSFSLREFEDGTKYVDVQTEQGIFDNISIEEMQRNAREIIKRRFSGKVIGISNSAFVNSGTANEYAYPSKFIKDNQIKEAKMRASPELDNLIEAGRNYRTEADGQYGHTHKNAVGGFTYFDVTFKVGNEYFEGVVNIENNKNGRRLKDVTKIRNVTKDIISSYGKNPKSKFLSDTSMDSIRNSEPNVKKSRRDSEGNELSQQQQEFFKDSKVRDKRGNLKVMYHGTPNGTFTVFNDGTYFTENKEYADLYQNTGASMLSVKKTANAPKTYEVYLNIKKPFDIRDAEARDIYINDYIKGGNAVGINPYMSDAEYRKIKTVDWTEGEDLRDFLIDNGYDYDGLILDEGATGGYGDDVKSRGVSYVIFSADQVKNVDNKNPTSDPDIRFSRRDSAEGLTKEEARAQAAAYTRLKAENAELQRRVEYWKGQTQRTKQATVRQRAPTMKDKAAKQGSADVISDIFRKEQT